MISPTATSLVYNNNPYALYTVPGANTNPLATVPQLLPNLTNASLQPAPQVSAPSILDPSLTTLGSMGSLQNLNSINNLLMPMRMNWSGVGKELKKVDTTDHFHIFVGDLSSELEVRQLRDAFSIFGEISDAKIIKDSQTGKSKGYGFVTFVNKEDAQKAISDMNGAWLGSRAIRTNWATRKPPAPIEKPAQKLIYDEVYTQSSSTNCTVYIGGIQQNLTEELMREAFNLYGNIQEVRTFPDKGFAFVRFDTKESACKAIVEVNGLEVGGFIVRCSWGKESNDNTNSPSPNYTQQLLSQLNGYPGLVNGYGLTNTGLQGYNSFNAAAAAAAINTDQLQALNHYAALAGSTAPSTFQYGNGY